MNLGGILTMSRAQRGPLLLSLAGLLLMCSLVAYWMGESELERERQAGILRVREAWSARLDSAIADRDALRKEVQADSEAGVDARREQAILEALKRIESRQAGPAPSQPPSPR